MFGLSHSAELALGATSIAMFVGTIVAVPIILMKVPDDYFVRGPRASSLLIKIVRDVLGVALIVVGIAMLVLPGQGVLTILVGLGLLDLPIKHRITARILRQPKVHHAVDSLRRKAGKGSLILPAEAGAEVC
jgi:archaellum biogenesis protein FlaJ (TadC family)